MLRFFAQILLVALILTTPLSCCGDKCPNFLPDFNLQKPLIEKTGPTDSILRRPPDITADNISSPFTCFVICRKKTPYSNRYRTPLNGRSPPVSSPCASSIVPPIMLIIV